MPNNRRPDPLSRIGVVSVMKVVRDCQRQQAHEKEITAEQETLNNELSMMNKEIETEQARLKTFKAGTPDYLDLYKSMVEKQARLQALQEYYQKSTTLKEKQWTDSSSRRPWRPRPGSPIRRAWPWYWSGPSRNIPSLRNGFSWRSAATRSLYAKGCVDLTSEVLAAMDKR